ncbi:unnamed protein product [Ranitomeya imitator]|uniref:Glutamate--cysteine ligase n=1 Tax=Ranitomeya imitator TaxID=111125 RepID=A0ABN9L190_9NEOB|nr:unnamed protein product [Ranitomeya imitator]
MHFGTNLPAHAPAILQDGGAQGEDGRTDTGRPGVTSLSAGCECSLPEITGTVCEGEAETQQEKHTGQHQLYALRLGCPGFTMPEFQPTPVEQGASKSLFFPDEAINKHPRFSTLTRNIRHRRGEKVAINVPIFKDQNTPSPFIERFANDPGDGATAALPDHVYMDAMGFGMGNCCLQVTFQACSILEARYLYDQLATICPIVEEAAVPGEPETPRQEQTAGGGVISASVDDRTKEERGLEPLKNDKYRISKSRYDSIDSYLSTCGEKYNDIDLTIDKEIYGQLTREGIDHLLAQHIAHLFIRDPLTLFEEKIHLDDANESDHFENIQSTNWQTMRFKPPLHPTPI